MPYNFSEQFRELQSQNEVVKHRLDEISIQLKAIDKKLDDNHKVTNTKIDDVINDAKTSHRLLEESISATNERIDIIDKKIDMIIDHIRRNNI